MYTDIVGYTAITEKDESLAIALNARHKQIIQDHIGQYKGILQEIIGDGSLSYFISASDCVVCAVALQKAFQEQPAIPVRIGIHIGEIRGNDGLVYGNALNVASRIESIAIAHSILLSRNVIDSISGKTSYEFLPLGSYSFKNVELPIEIYAIAQPGLRIPERDIISGKLKLLERKDIIVFDDWDDQELVRRINDASVICQQAVCSYGFINYNYTKLRTFIQRGGKFECVMIHPQSKALLISPERQNGAASDISYVQGQLRLAFQKLKGMPQGVDFRLTHHLPDPIMTFLDPDSEEGVLFITLTGFRMDLHERPSFVLRRTTHPRWFDFYYRSFRNLFESDLTEKVDINWEWGAISDIR